MNSNPVNVYSVPYKQSISNQVRCKSNQVESSLTHVSCYVMINSTDLMNTLYDLNHVECSSLNNLECLPKQVECSYNLVKCSPNHVLFL